MPREQTPAAELMISERPVGAADGAKLREAAAIVMCLSELDPWELLCGISGLDDSTLRSVALVGVLEFKRATESEEEFRAFVARLLEGPEPDPEHPSGPPIGHADHQTLGLPGNEADFR